MAKNSTEKPIQVRLLGLRTNFDKRVSSSGVQQAQLIRLAIEELLAKYRTPEATIAAVIRSRTAAMQKEAA